MANSYYERINQYIPRTRAVGEQVREDYDGVEAGFNKLPPHNNNGTGFDESFIVAYPASMSSPAQLQQVMTWPASVSANNHKLTNLSNPKNSNDAVNLEFTTSYVVNYTYSKAEVRSLDSKVSTESRSYTKDYVKNYAYAKTETSYLDSEVLRESQTYTDGILESIDSDAFREVGPIALLDQHISREMTIPAGKNALCISPTIDQGSTVSVPVDSIYVIL